MKRTLKMLFVIESGKTCTFSVDDPKNGLTKTEVDDVMNEMIEDRAILYNNSEATNIKDAYIYETNTVALA